MSNILENLAPPSVEEMMSPQISGEQNNNAILKKFTARELEWAIRHSPNTSPGYDRITYTTLTYLSEKAKLYMLEIFNNWWHDGQYTDVLKEVVICVLLKPNKPADDANSYRPIALLSCVWKTFERLIKRRLDHFLEKHKVLPTTQLGFRRGRGTADAVTHIVSHAQISLSENKEMACIFFDIRDAYNAINLKLLRTKLIRVGIPVQAASAIIELVRKRKVYVRDGKNHLLGPRLVFDGLPQGSILSPLLFNLYTLNLHESFDDSIFYVQYADDFAIFVIRDTYAECLRELKYITYTFKQWCHTNGFTIAENKSALMFFNRRRHYLEIPVTLSSLEIPVVSFHKYLGIYLDRKLIWRQHIDYLKNKCTKGMNLLKAVSKYQWGASPEVCLMYYKAYLRSILDYGSVFYGTASNSNLQILDRIQAGAIKLCLGLMKSTPTPVVLALANEMSLKHRRKLLATKLVLKWRLNGAVTITTLLASLSGKVLTTSYWKNKGCPPLVQGFLNSVNVPFLKIRDNLPTFLVPYEVFTTQIKVNIPSYGEYPLSNRAILAETLECLCSDTIIYTDGSKTLNGVGSGFYVETGKNHNTQRTFKLPDAATIFTAEATAILEALKWVQTSSTSKVVIASDSKAVLLGLLTDPFYIRNELLLEILSIHTQLIALTKTIAFVWVKGHCGIHGNEIVDNVAKTAVENGIPLERISWSDQLNLFQSQLNKTREEEWTHYCATSLNPFCLGHSSLKSCSKILTRLVKFQRPVITTLLRLLVNHAGTPAHLHRIGVKETPLCRCGQVGDLEHLFFGCLLLHYNSNVLTNKLLQRGLVTPFSIANILVTTKDSVVLRWVYQYTRSCGLQL